MGVSVLEVLGVAIGAILAQVGDKGGLDWAWCDFEEGHDMCCLTYLRPFSGTA